ncbi:MAG: HD domain-containing protein [Candidatus Aenigmatarchaeota archaeon]
MNLSEKLKKIPFLSLISEIAKKKNIKIWLVGGFLRDIYLGIKKIFYDFDFCVERDVLKVAKVFANKTNSKLIILDEKQLSIRVIFKKIYTYDFTLMRAKDFYQDLALRDFTINTLAVCLNEKPFFLLDYFNAKKDLDNKIIRVIKQEVFLDDPLRILRGFSFMANYGFRIEKITQKAMVKYKKFLNEVSGERLGEELFKIFNTDYSYKVLKKMDQLKIIDEIIPYINKSRNVSQGSYHHLDVWKHSLETLKEFENLYKKRLSKDEDIYNYLNGDLVQNRKRLQILKLACLVHDIGKPFVKKKKKKKTIFYEHEKVGRDLAEDIALKLRLSFKEKETLKKLVFWHLRPGYLADCYTPSQRAVYRFFRDTEEEGVGVILLSLSDWRATRGPLTDLKRRLKHEKIMFKLIKNYFEEKKKKPLPKIIDGYDIMRKFGISPSPLVGKILKKVREEQALGNIKTKSQAYNIAKKIIKLFK